IQPGLSSEEATTMNGINQQTGQCMARGRGAALKNRGPRLELFYFSLIISVAAVARIYWIDANSASNDSGSGAFIFLFLGGYLLAYSLRSPSPLYSGLVGSLISICLCAIALRRSPAKKG
ncbi:MAG: hypothetical protein ABL949_07110, partial [Fimbriimonadaceae bacterium]